ncbi:MAG: virulence factor [Alphaproteobacteria bacterium]|nr:virulence factor [Alphaproteobacteria bacterium]
MASIEIIYWQDIPTQVVLRFSRRDQQKHQLTERFMLAVDRAAMKAKKRSDDDYLEAWRKQAVAIDAPPSEGETGDPQADSKSHAEQAFQRLIAELESRYTDDVLEALILAGGQAETPVLPAAGAASTAG